MIEAGTVLQNRYLVQKQIGAGGMGTVYLAVDQRFESPVAIKETLFKDEDLQKAFEREAQLLNRLRHSALPRVTDYFNEGDGLFIVMEYIPGADLSAILRQTGAFPVSQVLHWADELLDALEYLHTHNPPVIHRDIKPQNLKLTTRGEIILLDFGLAKGKAGDTSKLSLNNSVFGYSRSYAPLEQIQGTGTDTRSDIYSLAATLYHLLTGKPPADALTRATAYVNNQSDPLRSASELNQQVPASVAKVLQQALELNAGLRWQSARAMREAFQKAAQDVSLTTASQTQFIKPSLFADAEATELSANKSNAAPNAHFVISSQASLSESLESVIKTGQLIAPKNLEAQLPNAAEKAELPAETFHFSAQSRMFEARTQNSWKTFLSIAAAVVILGGVGFAAWYATSQPIAGQDSNQTQIIDAPVDNKTGARDEISKTPLSNSASNLNIKAQVGINTPTADSKRLDVQSKTTIAPSPKTEGSQAAADATTASSEAKPREPEVVSPSPIVVRSAPASNAPKKRKSEVDDSNGREESDSARKTGESPAQSSNEDNPESRINENPREERGRRRNEEQVDTRQRRVREKRQKLPTILGAPPEN